MKEKVHLQAVSAMMIVTMRSCGHVGEWSALLSWQGLRNLVSP